MEGFMEILKQIINNRILWVGILSWFLAQVFKTINNVIITTFLQRPHIRNCHIFVAQFNGLRPTCHPALVAGIAGWLITVAIIAATIHKVPVSIPCPPL